MKKSSRCGVSRSHGGFLNDHVEPALGVDLRELQYPVKRRVRFEVVFGDALDHLSKVLEDLVVQLGPVLREQFLGAPSVRLGTLGKGALLLVGVDLLKSTPSIPRSEIA